jgi:hypothetical protein
MLVWLCLHVDVVNTAYGHMPAQHSRPAVVWQKAAALDQLQPVYRQLHTGLRNMVLFYVLWSVGHSQPCYMLETSGAVLDHCIVTCKE